MTSVTVATYERDMDTAARTRCSLEELVDRLMKTLFSLDTETASRTPTPTLASTIHEARRLRQVGQIDGALAMLAGMNMSRAETGQTAIRRQGRSGVQPGHRQGHSTRSP